MNDNNQIEEEKIEEEISVEEDKYDGVILTVQKPMDSVYFASQLKDSISHWKKQGKKGMWINLPILHSNLVDSAVKAGFSYHHAEPDYLMLVYRIPDTSVSIPANASHRVGIGAFVVNNKNEVLVVQEISGKFVGTGVWKMPTGVVDEGEDICDAAIREVKEETGRQDSEIEAAKWMPVEDYAAQPFVQKNELFKFIAKICLTKLDGNYTGFSNVASTTTSGKRAYLYFNNDANASDLLASKHEQL